MSALLVSILIPTATAAVGKFFQHNSANLENRRQLRDAELKQAEVIFEEVSPAIDVLYYYLRHAAMRVAVRKAKGDNTREKQDVETWDGYEKALLNWMAHKNRLLAQVHQYFGEENSIRLKKIEKVLDKARSSVNATYYNTDNSVVKDGKDESWKFYQMLDNEDIEQVLIDLNQEMIKEIQSRNVGQLRKE